MATTGGSGSGEGWRRLGRRLGLDLRAGEGLPALLLFCCFFLFITFQYATKSVRQSSFIDDLGAVNLPWVYLSVALVSYPFVRLYGRLSAVASHRRLIAGSSLVIGASLVLFWWLFGIGGSWVAAVFYVWISLVYAATVSQFWTVSNHVFDARQAKRLFGFIGAGGLLGGVAGGQVARWVASLVDTRSTLLVATGALALAAALIYRVGGRPPADESAPGRDAGSRIDSAAGGFDTLRESRHLRLIAVLVVLTVAVAQIVDLQFNWAVEEATTSLEQRTRLFGNFYSIMGVSAFLFQIAFTARIHRILGVGVSLRVLPVSMAVGTVGLLLAAGSLPTFLLAAAMTLKVGENGLRYSLDQATRELLFLPVPSSLRVRAKAFIDVFVQRGAKGLAALLLLPVTFGLLTALEVGWVSLALIAVWLLVTVLVHREYVRSFRLGLRRRTVDGAIPINLQDVTTLELLVQSLGSFDPRQVLQSLELLEANGRGNLVPPLLLYHDDAQVRRRTLEILAASRRTDAAELVERRLADADPEVRAAAISALSGLQGRDACEVMLPRLEENDPRVRAAAVACLATHGDAELQRRAAEVLTDLRSEADPGIRREAAKATGAVREPLFRADLLELLHDPEVDVVRTAIAAVRRRVARDGPGPLYLPRLVALLGNRRVKHEAREALVAFGEAAVPALAHFMSDPDETLWVRRALPRTLAQVGTAGAVSALSEWLGRPADGFQRRKLIEALGSLPEELRATVDRGAVEAEIRAEAGRFLQAQADLVGLRGGAASGWERLPGDPAAERDEELLEKLLGERAHDHRRNLFGLLAILHPPRHVWASYSSLLGSEPRLRSNALEYLDNELSGKVHRDVFAVIEDAPVERKMERARHRFGTAVRPRLDILRQLLVGGRRIEPDAQGPTLAALYAVHTSRHVSLLPEVERLRAESNDELVGETAAWVAERLPAGSDGSGDAPSERRSPR